MMMRRAVAAVAAAIAWHAAAASPVAFVSDVSGSATIAGDGRLGFLAELEAGTRLFLGTGARATITFAQSGNEFTAAGPGEFVVEAREVRADKGPTPARREVPPLRDSAVIARVSRAATASLRMRGVPREGARGVAPPLLEYPVDTRIATLQPVLRWRGNAETGDAKVTLRNEAGKEVWSARTSAASLKPGVKLSAATRYTWTLMTPRGTPVEARFETLPAETLARVERSRASARAFSERVLHAILLQELGAEQDARDAWAGLARERPDLPELARLAN